MGHRRLQLSELPEASWDARRRALHVLSLMRREGHSLKGAAREARTTAKTVLKYAGTAVSRQRNGHYKAKPYDRLVRPMKFLTRDGKVTLDVKDSRSASRIGQYMAAVHEYLKTGNEQVLRRYLGKSVTVDRVAHPFVTDAAALERLEAAGEVSFEDMYTIKR